MSDLRAGLRALITEYGRDGGNDDIDNVLDRAIALMTPEPGSVTLSRDEVELAKGLAASTRLLPLIYMSPPPARSPEVEQQEQANRDLVARWRALAQRLDEAS